MMKRKLLYPAAVALVALPMFVGFAGPDVAPGRWSRVAETSGRLVKEFLQLTSASADDSAPSISYREALDILKRDYSGAKLDAKKTKDLTYAAIHGMLGSLHDPHTSFLNATAWQQMRQSTQGSFEGVGLRLEMVAKETRVQSPIPESPAIKAGIKAGDVIIAVGTHNHRTGALVKTTNTTGLDVDEVVKLVKGPRGTKVTLTVLRKGSPQPLSFELSRAHIEPPLVTWWMEDDVNKIGHIQLSDFYETATAQFDKAFNELTRKGMKALIFDLRDNGGGLLETAIEISSRFVDPGDTVVIVQEKSGKRTQLRSRTSGRRTVKMPLVVLINESSASASEIVSGAIQDHGLGQLVGQHTFGKGLVQTIMDLEDGSALKVTTAKYFTPNGNDINNKYDDEHRPIPNTGGVKPDIVVKQSEDYTFDFEDKKNDTQLKKAIELLRTRLAQSGGTLRTP